MSFKVAFLGPTGTYSHQAVVDKFGSDAEYIPQSTISDVFNAVSDEIPYAVIPQENSTFGQVIETYDNLRSPKAGKSVFIRGETTSTINHCLLVRKGVKAEDIRVIISHEQALGQCRKFISEHFPNAVTRKFASTAGAAKFLLDDEDSPEGASAAVCSSICATLFDGLEVLHKNIQDNESNFTRFLVLSNTLDVNLPTENSPFHLRRALVRFGIAPSDPESSQNDPSPIASRTFHNRPLNLIVSTLFTTFGVPVTRVDRRPSLNSHPFEDVYFVELEELGSTSNDQGGDNESKAGDVEWLKKIEVGVDRIQQVGLEAAIIGLW
ncbi:Prephenate dehydratase-domain-containing protein [Abortiporus biennis]|nr:Prephenate dehydratase-domain-containing protein [Abortiporus biennis]